MSGGKQSHDRKGVKGRGQWQEDDSPASGCKQAHSRPPIEVVHF